MRPRVVLKKGRVDVSASHYFEDGRVDVRCHVVSSRVALM